MRNIATVVVAGLLLVPGTSQAQPAPRRVLQLGALQDAAVASDPRSGELALLAEQSELRLQNIRVQKRPSLNVESLAQYQSDVPRPLLTLAGGAPLFSASKATYDAYVRVEQRIVDPTLGAQAALERARLAEEQARIRTALFARRQEVNEAFFAAAALEQRTAVLTAAIDDLNGRLREVTARVEQGTALRADAAAVEATLLQRQQEVDEIAANRRAALATLTRLTGQPIGDGDELVLPDLDAAVAAARAAPDDLRARPEYAQFDQTRTRLERQGDAAAAAERPQLSTFARVGYGRPGLNFIGHEFETYGVGGVQLRWRAWTWGAAGREQEALELQRRMVAAEQAAFTRTLGPAVERDLATIDRLTAALALDERIISLRQEIDRTARVRFTEGAITASESVDRNTELVQAGVARAAHRVERAQASARLLTSLGLEVR